MSIIKVEWDKEAAGVVQGRLEGLRGAQQRQAMRFAISDTVRWAATQTVRRLSQVKHMPQKILRAVEEDESKGIAGRKGRVIAKLASKDKLRGEVWVGVGGVRAIYIGPARQTKDGVYVSAQGGRLSFPHAFIRTMPTGHVGIFRFPSSKYRPSRYTSRRFRTPQSTPNLPIEEVKVQLQPEAGRIIAALQAEVTPRLIDLVARKIQQFIDSGAAPGE